ncbi:T9SS type B sorting domain-containing protein [Chryseolinea sp. H1M3-3]|uniref:T9SS type B sorting domain-containing protein n=1 Tax=Chryseolinea sp. H1M3-3 TaxID=3034144 RepID=UPI0023ECBA14|nr:T9SS type B sorting domain-containing protein [Chryseolinea sp. H1M3-3]
MKLKISIAFFLVGITFALHAQHNSKGGRFTVDQIKGCAPLTVNITSINAPYVCNGTTPCEMLFESPPNGPGFEQLNYSYTYDTPGIYTIVVLFQAGVGTDEITVEVLPNIQPEFEIYSCGSNAVQVKVTDTNYQQYVIDFNDATPTVTVLSGNLATATHTFASQGNKTITVRGLNIGADDNCNPASKVVNAVPSLPVPTITQLTVLNDRDIQLDFNNQNNVLYRLQIAQNSAAGFQNLQNVYEVSTTTINNLRTDDNYYCFRLGVYDPCNNTTVYSNIICSSNFDVTAQNNLNRLTWATSSAGVSNYSFTKNSNPPLSAASNATSLNDPNVTCGVEYCYQQTTNYANGSRSISLSKCATAISTNTPTVVENISTIVGTDSDVTLQWTQDPAFVADGYAITKSVNGTFASTDSSATTTYTDAEYLNDVASCYKIVYGDACENKSPVSLEVCPLQLMGTLQPNNSVTLTWGAYLGWKNGVDHYIVEKFNDQGQVLSTINTGTALTYTDNTQDLSSQVAMYRVTAVANQAGIVSSVSNTITIIKEPNLFYPTAFTPNADGLNDIFNVFGQFIVTFEMRIFNRWGEMMYVTDDLEKGWDGYFKGTLMPEGTYVFRATITDEAGRTFDRSGTLVLLRKN